MYYQFINPVYFFQKIYGSNSSPNYFLTISGINQLNITNTNVINSNYGNINGNLFIKENLTLNSYKNCNGKLYTDINGNINCGIDNVNDNDNDSYNEIQNLYSVLKIGNNAGNQKITNVLNPTNPNDVATKEYVDSKSNSFSPKLDIVGSVISSELLYTSGGGGFFGKNIASKSKTMNLDGIIKYSLYCKISMCGLSYCSGVYKNGVKIYELSRSGTKSGTISVKKGDVITVKSSSESCDMEGNSYYSYGTSAVTASLVIDTIIWK